MSVGLELISPHGGELKDLYLQGEALEQAAQQAREVRSWNLTHRQLCDIEMLLDGAFSPLEGFLGRADYESVLEAMRLADGTLWPIPVTLDVSAAFAAETGTGETIALRDQEGVVIALMDVTDNWQPDKSREAELVYGADDQAHPAVFYLHQEAGSHYLGGRLRGIEAPRHYDFNQHRYTPAELRRKFSERGWNKVVAFQTRNPMHRAHVELTFRAAAEVGANLVINPVVGMTKPGDIDHYSRVRCYEHVLKKYPEATTMLVLLPLAMRMGGPREAVLHAIIRKNYGFTHLIVGRDHAGPGANSAGEDFYGPYDAQELVKQHEKELEIAMVPFRLMVYVEERAEYEPVDEVEEGAKVLKISGTEFRRRLQEGLEIPEWFSYPEVVEELRRTHPPKDRQGFTVFLTGLPSSGKSTIANALMVKLLELGERRVTLLDGDVVRRHLSSELTFSREHRDLNILRIGFVASEITKNGGACVCAPIAPYASTRRKVREMITPLGGFVEIHVATPVEVCEERDRKGLYAQARAGRLTGFTGVDDPYEVPENPELRIDTTRESPEQAAQEIILKLEALGYIR